MNEARTPGARLHRALTRLLLPRRFRREHGEELVRTFLELREEARRTGGWRAAFRVLVRELAGLTALAGWERSAARRARAPAHGNSNTEGGMKMGDYWAELRLAARGLVRRPGYALVAVATLALGIGSSTAIFSVARGVLLDTLPYAEPDRVVLVGETDVRGGYDGLSYENFVDWRREGSAFRELALVVPNSVAVTGDGEPERIRGLFVTASYFDLAGVQPALGRAIAEGEDVPGGPRTAVLSHGFWERRFGGDPAVLGGTVVLNHEPHTVVGVMPPGFREVWDTPEALISLHTAPRRFDRSSRSFSAMARLSDGVTLDGARSALDGLAARLAEVHPDANGGRGAWATPLGDIFSSGERPLLLSLLGAVAVLLLIACANVASLQVARASGRAGELAVRAALGGSRARLAAGMLGESLLVAAAGGALGVLVARLGVLGLVALNPRYGVSFDVGLDGRALAFGLALAGVTGVLLGLAPGWWAARTDVATVMRAGGRGSSGGVGARRIRAGAVVLQAALATTLLVGAGLLAGATARLLDQDVGFRREGLLTMEFRLPSNGYPDDAAVAGFFRRLAERLRAVPGAGGVTTAHALPFADSPDGAPFLLEGRGLEEADRAPRMGMVSVSPGYFEVMGIPVLAGRALDEGDRQGALPVAVISRTAARRFFDGEEPLGKRFYFTEERDVATVVGVVDDVRNRLGAEHEALVYLSVLQRPVRFASLVVRTEGDPMALAPAVREAVWSIDPDQPVWEVMPLEARIRSALARERLATLLFAAFAAMAVFLCSLGLYGVMARAVAHRRRELGVRLALGAGNGRVVGMVVRDGLRLVAAGLVLGLGAAAAGGRTLGAAVVGLDPTEPLPYAGAAVLLMGVALAATWLPARRAAALDPVGPLRAE